MAGFEGNPFIPTFVRPKKNRKFILTGPKSKRPLFNIVPLKFDLTESETFTMQLSIQDAVVPFLERKGGKNL